MVRTVGRAAYVAVIVEPELVERMDAVARELGVSRSDVVRDWLRRGGDDYGREQTLLRQVRSVGGR